MPEKRRIRPSHKELLNWLSKLAFLKIRYFLMVARLLILANFSNNTDHFPHVVSSHETELTLYVSL